MDQLLTITGFPRSGSTLVYQICNQIIQDQKSRIYKHKKNSIFRTHKFTMPGTTFNKNVIVCIRDPRDALLSFSKLTQAGKKLNINDWLSFLNDAVKMYRDRSKDGYFILRYEFFHPDNLIAMYREICDIMDADFDIRYGGWLIKDRFSLQKAVAVSNSIGDFAEYNTDMIHGQHVTNNGKIGGWRTELPEDLLELVQPYVKELDYA